ncbi:MAG: aspartate/glutamate racemase family protein [Bryobacteraceae bacterium]
MSQPRIAFIHASPAAVDPVRQFYKEAAPEFEVTNLLDDGVMRLLASERPESCEERLAEMLATARWIYNADVAILTCSAVPRSTMAGLRAGAGYPVLKVDEPMARMAVAAGRRIGIVATFPNTRDVTRGLVLDAAAEAGVEVHLLDEVVPEALQALMAGDPETHDRLLLEAAEHLVAQQIDALVLAQVSMRRLLGTLSKRHPVPVLSSLDTSLAVVREMLAQGRTSSAP